MADFALALFDYDGCTAIVNAKKYPTFTKSARVQITWGGARHLIEVLELSDIKSNLDEFESEWSLSHRAIALDEEKERRVTSRSDQFHGCLAVWPSDEEEQGTPQPPPVETQAVETRAAESPASKTARKGALKRKTTLKSLPAPKKKDVRKQGNKDRAIVVLHEGSGEADLRTAPPTRQPNFEDHLRPDEVDIVNGHVKNYTLNQRSIGTQTEKVIIVQSEDELSRLCRKDTSTTMTQTDTHDTATCTDKLDRIFDILTTDTNVTLHQLLHATQNRLSVSELFPSPLRPLTTESTTNQHMFLPSTSKENTDEAITEPDQRPSELAEIEEVTTILQEADMVMVIEAPDMSFTALLSDIPGGETEATPQKIPIVTPLHHIAQYTQPSSSVSLPMINDFIPNPFDIHLAKPHTLNSSFVEIDSYADITRVGDSDKIRIHKDVVRATKDSSNTVTQFGWSLAQRIYSPTELSELNYFGRGKPGFSPRRRGALEEAVYDTYGKQDGLVKLVGNSINTSLRGYRWRRKRAEAIERVGNSN